jgi:hypothetical protein
MAENLVIKLATDTPLRLRDFTNVETDTFITNATVTATLWNESTGAQIGGTIAMALETGGTYKGTIPYDIVGLSEGLRVRIECFADGGSGLRMTLHAKAVVKVPS